MRNGTKKSRIVLTGVGPMKVRQPSVDDVRTRLYNLKRDFDLPMFELGIRSVFDPPIDPNVSKLVGKLSLLECAEVIRRPRKSRSKTSSRRSPKDSITIE